MGNTLCFGITPYPSPLTSSPSSTRCYTYYGGEGEYVPIEATEVIIHHSVTTIKYCISGYRSPFRGCTSLVKVTMPDTVTRIEEPYGGGGIFKNCTSLKSIRLSRNLEFIGTGTFAFCTSLESVFLPPTIKQIKCHAFIHCKSLRILSLPESMQLIGNEIILGCPKLLRTVQYRYKGGEYLSNNNEVNLWLQRQYDKFPLHKICYSTRVTVQMIEDCIQRHGKEYAAKMDALGMLAIDVLKANPHATPEAIEACEAAR
mmetsp:Transcript_15734/g.19183  ORF Transcript_15734/g.19183 Transcript_15734/m.19183 type:complete len:258 (+) Transcript_15734:486-1259(+)